MNAWAGSGAENECPSGKRAKGSAMVQGCAGSPVNAPAGAESAREEVPPSVRHERMDTA